MRPSSGSCRKVDLNKIARQQKRKSKSSSKYRTLTLDNFNLTKPHHISSMDNKNNNHHNPIMECEFKTTNLKTNKMRTLKKKVRLSDIRKVDNKLNVKDNFKVEYNCRSKDGKYQHSFSKMKFSSNSNSHKKHSKQKSHKRSKKLSSLYNNYMMNNNDNNEYYNINKIKPVMMINNNTNASSRLFSKPTKKKPTKVKKSKTSSKKKPTKKKPIKVKKSKTSSKKKPTKKK